MIRLFPRYILLLLLKFDGFSQFHLRILAVFIKLYLSINFTESFRVIWFYSSFNLIVQETWNFFVRYILCRASFISLFFFVLRHVFRFIFSLRDFLWHWHSLPYFSDKISSWLEERTAVWHTNFDVDASYFSLWHPVFPMLRISFI